MSWRGRKLKRRKRGFKHWAGTKQQAVRQDRRRHKRVSDWEDRLHDDRRIT